MCNRRARTLGHLTGGCNGPDRGIGLASGFDVGKGRTNLGPLRRSSARPVVAESALRGVVRREAALHKARR